MRTALLYLSATLFIAACGGGGGGGGGGGNTPSNGSNQSSVNLGSTATLTKLSLKASKTTIYVGDPFEISAVGTYSDGSTSSAVLNYTSTPEGLISGSFYMTASKPGIVTIKGTPYGSNPNNVTGVLSLEIKDVVLEALQFDGGIYAPGNQILPKKITQYIFNTGEIIPIKVNGSYSNGRIELNVGGVMLSSDNSAVATVNSNGMIVATGEGSVVISAQTGLIKSTLPLTIVKPLASPIFTVKCSGPTQAFSASTWNMLKSFDPTNLYKWVAFDESTCPSTTQWALTSVETTSLFYLYLAKKDGVMYRYSMPDAQIGKNIEIRTLDSFTGYAKSSEIGFY